MLKKIKDDLFFYYLVLMTLLLLFIPKELGSLFGIIPIRLLLMGILFLLYFFDLFIKKKKMKRPNKVILILSSLLLLSVIPGFFVASSKLLYIYMFAKILCFLFLLFVLITYPFEKKHIKALCNCLIITSVFVSVIAIIQYVIGVDLNFNGIYKYIGSKGRASSTFFNPIYLGIYLLFINTLILSKIFKKYKFSYLYFIIFIINLIAMMLTYTRTTAVLFLINIIIFIIVFILKKINKKKNIILGLFVLIVTYAVIILIPGVKYLYSSTLVSLLPENLSYEILKFSNKYMLTDFNLEVYGFDKFEKTDDKNETNKNEESIEKPDDKKETSKNEENIEKPDDKKETSKNEENMEKPDDKNETSKNEENMEKPDDKNETSKNEENIDKTEDASLNSRKEFKKLAEYVIKENKLFGVGLGNYEKYAKENFPKYGIKKFGYPHNSFLHLEAEAGVISSFCLNMIMIFLIVYLFIKYITTKSNNILAMLLIWLDTYILLFYESLIFDTQLLPLLLILTILFIKNSEDDNSKNIMFISSVGGHLTQLLELKSIFNSYNYVLITDKTDVTISMKQKFNMNFLVYGSRQYKFSYPFIFIYNCLKSLYLFIKYNPSVIVTTGTHTAVPMCYIGWIFGRKVIYIESFAKRTSPTLSGRMVYPIATKFIVQWENMIKFYPKAEYWGGIY